MVRFTEMGTEIFSKNLSKNHLFYTMKFLALVVAPLILLDKAQAETAKNYYEQCMSKNAERSLSACTIFISHSKSSDERLAFAYERRGIAYSQIKLFDKALTDLDKAIDIRPKYARFYSKRAVIYHIIRQFDKAITDFSRAISFAPGEADYYTGRALAYQKKKQFKNAIKDFSEAIKLKKNHENYLLRGRAFQQQKKFKKALSDYNDAIELSPDEPMLYAIRAVIYHKMGNREAFESDQKKYNEMRKVK